MAVSAERITVYNLADLKNTSDDAIPNYLNSLKFTQSHRLTDVRLALGYSAFVVAAACFLWDFKFGFESTKYYTAVAVALYSLLNGVLTYWIFSVEKGTVYTGTAPSGETLRISTSTKKNVPEYYLSVEVEQPRKNGGKTETLVVVRSFTNWFDEAGHFVVKPFQSMLASAIPIVGKLDPKRLESSEDQPPAYTSEMLDALTSAGVSAVGTAAETATGADASSSLTGNGKKGGPAGKRRKA
ncbi:microsomal signal peptidase 25 kDa subunit-domain-containing protein [Apodospora peruviana]|uniref:Signal peptidase complex subunit 2 n=1 Tax=Apodospora peruviana TaxID=516989 RepID=A0AAE0MFK7_9PEZI|nr:microsomal signal peptidase 25 kDa subunit-domain-containing protein [Apodospora peruviana]